MNNIYIWLTILFLTHLFEEQVWPGHFRRWWNLSLWKSGREDFPLGKGLNIVRNSLGLLIAGLVLIWTSPAWHPSLFILLGFILCDGILHVSLSFFTKKYFPGAVTAILYIAIPILMLTNLPALPVQSDYWVIWMLLGAGALLETYLESWILIKKNNQ